MNGNLWNASFVCFLLAAAAAVISAVFRQWSRKNEKYHSHAEGRVVSIKTEPAERTGNRSEFHDRQFAVIEYIAEGKLVKVKSPETFYPCPYYVGQKFRLCYDRSDPQNFEICTEKKWRTCAALMYGTAIILTVFGCILFLMFAARVEI